MTTNDLTNVRTNISAEMRGAVGTLLGRLVSFPVTESDIRRWAVAVYYPERPPARFWNADAAAASPFGGFVAPEDIDVFAWMAAEGEVPGDAEADPESADLWESMIGIPGPGLQFMLNGGLDVEYGAPIRPGDVITSETRLASYSERPGRLGLMLFTVTDNVWTNQNGEFVKRLSATLIRY